MAAPSASSPTFGRAGIHCRTVGDAARVLDAIRQSDGTYYDPRDIYTAIPRSRKASSPRRPTRASSSMGAREKNRSPACASGSFASTWSSTPRPTRRCARQGLASLNANSKYFSESRAVAMRNWEHTHNILSDGITRRVKMRDVIRLVVLNVMHANDIDLFVNPTITISPALIGHASEP